jgi:hypothetical protein
MHRIRTEDLSKRGTEWLCHRADGQLSAWARFMVVGGGVLSYMVAGGGVIRCADARRGRGGVIGS